MKILLTIVALLVSKYAAAQTEPGGVRAFPGAQGGGATTPGGRGGRVMMVTNLGNSGPGSLRDCMIATEPRTCVFRTGGTINLNSTIQLRNPFITIAGHTAPGGGITLRGTSMAGHLIEILTTDVIIRYIRPRKGFNDSCCIGNNIINYGENVIIDHVSSTWNQDDGLTAINAADVTFSYNIAAEGLDPHATGFWLAGTSTENTNRGVNIDLHHNLIPTNSHRNPLFRTKSGRFVNNIIYNQKFWLIGMSGGSQLDVINSKFERGPLAPNLGNHEVRITGTPQANSPTGTPSLFMEGNIGWHQPDPAGEQFVMARNLVGDHVNSAEGGPIPENRKRFSPLPTQTFPITAVPVENIDDTILPTVGASQRLDCDGNWVPNRDAVDERLINQYINKTGRTTLVQDENQVGGYPTIAAGTPCPDADLDGMPDAFESARPGLSNSNPADRNGDLDKDGYTNLEEYMDGMPDGP